MSGFLHFLYTHFINSFEEVMSMRKDVYERYDLLIIDELGYLPISAN